MTCLRNPLARLLWSLGFRLEGARGSELQNNGLTSDASNLRLLETEPQDDRGEKNDAFGGGHATSNV
jgi:hypothetical protein